MLLIDCPWCGPRDETEFGYGGQRGVAYPEAPEATSNQRWGRFLFYRANPEGLLPEQWCHQLGCRRWFAVDRDTRTNEIVATHPFDELGRGA